MYLGSEQLTREECVVWQPSTSMFVVSQQTYQQQSQKLFDEIF